VAAAQAGDVSGFWNSAYGVSKMGVTQFTRIQGKLVCAPASTDETTMCRATHA